MFFRFISPGNLHVWLFNLKSVTLWLFFIIFPNLFRSMDKIIWLFFSFFFFPEHQNIKFVSCRTFYAIGINWQSKGRLFSKRKDRNLFIFMVKKSYLDLLNSSLFLFLFSFYLFKRLGQLFLSILRSRLMIYLDLCKIFDTALHYILVSTLGIH